MTSISPAQPQATAQSPSQTLGILSLVGGIAGILLSQTVIIPIAAIVLGFLSRSQEPHAHKYANWGIVLGFVALFGGLLLVALAAAVAAPFFLWHWVGQL